MHELGYPKNEMSEMAENMKKMLSHIEGLVNKEYKVFSTEEMQKVLGVSKKTLSTYRSNGVIGFSQIDSKIFFTAADLEEFLVKYHKKPFNN